MAVILIGTLDTKGVECQFVHDLLTAAAVPVLVVDAGGLGAPADDRLAGRDLDPDTLPALLVREEAQGRE
jgi:uncharacterized protein (UPF0261 family)